MSNEDATSETGSRRPSKVERVIGEYGLGDLGAELEARWTGATGDRSSLRELAHEFNRQVLRAAMDAADVRVLDGEIENTYRLLTDSEVSNGMRRQTRRQLERSGVDIDTVENDFVSHQAVHTYLRAHRGASHPSTADEDATDRLDREANKIQALKSRTAAVTDDTISRLATADAVEIEQFSVFVDVNVLCESCGTAKPVSRFLEAGGCRCRIDG